MPCQAGKRTWAPPAAVYSVAAPTDIATSSAHYSAVLVSNVYAGSRDKPRDGGPRIRPQHAVEVVGDDLVVSEQTLVALYKRIGHPSRAAANAGWETIAAQETGYRVRRELVESTGMSMAAQLFDSGHL